MTDWSDAFDLEHGPFRFFERDLPQQAGMPSRCTVTLVSSLGGFAARVSCLLDEPIAKAQDPVEA
jgi:hypothetical protein